MSSVQKAFLPGLAIGILFMIFFTSLLAAPKVVLASDNAPVSQKVQSSSAGQPKTNSSAGPGGCIQSEFTDYRLFGQSELSRIDPAVVHAD